MANASGAFTCACIVPISCASFSSPWVPGVRGCFDSTHCTGANPPCLDISFMAFRASLRIMSIDSCPTALVSVTIFLMIRFNRSPLLSVLPMCSGDSSAAFRTRTPLLEKVLPNVPRLCRPLSQLMCLGHPAHRTHPFTNAFKQLLLDGTPCISAALTIYPCCSVVPLSTQLRML